MRKGLGSSTWTRKWTVVETAKSFLFFHIAATVLFFYSFLERPPVSALIG